MSVLITGANGFLGRNLIRQMVDYGYKDVVGIDINDADLTNENEIESIFHKYKPEYVVHCAAKLGSLEYMQKYSNTIFYDNIRMNLNVMEYSRKHDVKKLINIGTASSYPENIEVPYKESQYWQDLPEKTIRGYAMAKKFSLIHQEMCWEQYDFSSIYLVLANLYGPGFIIGSKYPHVIPSIIIKMYNAKINNLNNITLWGNGNQTREFLYVDDATNAIILSLDKYNDITPLNIGSGYEISIKDLAEMVRNIVGFTGEILWDNRKPTGQSRRILDVSRASFKIGFKSKVELKQGLTETINWYYRSVKL